MRRVWSLVYLVLLLGAVLGEDATTAPPLPATAPPKEGESTTPPPPAVAPPPPPPPPPAAATVPATPPTAPASPPAAPSTPFVAPTTPAVIPANPAVAPTPRMADASRGPLADQHSNSTHPSDKPTPHPEPTPTPTTAEPTVLPAPSPERTPSNDTIYFVPTPATTVPVPNEPLTTTSSANGDSIVPYLVVGGISIAVIVVLIAVLSLRRNREPALSVQQDCTLAMSELFLAVTPRREPSPKIRVMDDGDFDQDHFLDSNASHEVEDDNLSIMQSPDECLSEKSDSYRSSQLSQGGYSDIFYDDAPLSQTSVSSYDHDTLHDYESDMDGL